jgi:putative peptidoglycan lipid II flippase
MLVKLLSTGFYSRQDIRTPVKLSMATLVINMILNAVLIVPLAHAGLALATSLSSWTNVALLIYGLHKKDVYRFQKGWGIFALRMLLANGCVVAFLWWVQGPIQQWFAWHWQQRILHLLMFFSISAAIYIISLTLTGLRWKDMLFAKEVTE